jgi:hypothetical protein
VEIDLMIDPLERIDPGGVFMDVRASDGLRVEYDFDRDGWSIQQPRNIARETGPNRTEQFTTWHEVYFAPSWALESEEM